MIHVDHLAEVIGHADRVVPSRDYRLGLFMPLARKGVEPMAAVTAPARAGAKHQSLLHFVGQVSWLDEALMVQVRDHVPPVTQRHGPSQRGAGCATGFRNTCGVAPRCPSAGSLTDRPDRLGVIRSHEASPAPARRVHRARTAVAGWRRERRGGSCRSRFLLCELTSEDLADDAFDVRGDVGCSRHFAEASARHRAEG